MTFIGASGKGYSIDCYVSDVSGASLTFDSGGGAGASSESFWKAPEDVVLVDFSIVTGLTDTTFSRLTVNGRPLGQIIRWANHLNTLATRPRLNVGFAAGVNVSGIQG